MIDYRFMLYHRKLRTRFKMETLTKHENKLIRAIYQRLTGRRT